MKLSLFYEIPVPLPWTKDSESRAYREVLEQVALADEVGFHAVWTVEHHFLSEFSHCSNPEVLYGALAVSTRNIRIGYGVRLMPKPYNHPVRTAESVATLDILSGGRVDFATGRSISRSELEGFGVDPGQTREMMHEATEHIIGCWVNDEHSFEGKYWSMPRRRVVPKPVQSPHPPVFAATASDESARVIGDLGLGLCSFGIGRPPETIKPQLDIYRAAIAQCSRPIGKFVNTATVVATVVSCARTAQEARSLCGPSAEWYANTGYAHVASTAEYIRQLGQSLGTYSHTAEVGKFKFEEMLDNGSIVCGDPDGVIRTLKRYEAVGVDNMMCLVQPHSIPHEAVMQTIELIGKYVIPEFA